MPNNIIANQPIAVTCIQSATFATLNFDSTNITVIHRIGTPPASWIPTRSINPISGFVNGDGYIIIAKVSMDLSNFVVPPIPNDLSTMQQWVIANYSPLGHIHAIADITGLQSSLNAKQDALVTGTTSQYFKGDLSLGTFAADVIASLPSQTSNSGKYLTTNGSALSWATVDLSAYPTGSGTSGYVTRWTGTNTLGTGIIQDDGTKVTLGGNITFTTGSKTITMPSNAGGAGYGMTISAGDATVTGQGGSITIKGGDGINGVGRVNLGRANGVEAINVLGSSTFSNAGPNTGTLATFLAGGLNALTINWDNLTPFMQYALVPSRQSRFTGSTSYAFDNKFIIKSTTDHGEDFQVNGTSYLNGAVSITGNATLGSARTNTHAVYGTMTVGEGGTGSDQTSLWVKASGTGGSKNFRVTDASNNDLISTLENGYIQLGGNIRHAVSSSTLNFVANGIPLTNYKFNIAYNNGGSTYSGVTITSNVSGLPGGGATVNHLTIDPTYNWTTAGSITMRGIYYNPTVTTLVASGGLNHTAFENTIGNNYWNSTSGNSYLGYSSGTSSPSAKLNVLGRQYIDASSVTASPSFEVVVQPSLSTNGYFGITKGGQSIAGNTKVTINASSIYGHGTSLFMLDDAPNTTPWAVTSAYAYSAKGIKLAAGTVLSASNQSSLGISVSNTNEFLTGASYPSADNFYFISTAINSPVTATNTGLTGVRAPLYLDARQLRLFGSSSGGTLSSATPALMVNESNRVIVNSTSDHGEQFQVNGSSYLNGTTNITGDATFGGRIVNGTTTISSYTSDFYFKLGAGLSGGNKILSLGGYWQFTNTGGGSGELIEDATGGFAMVKSISGTFIWRGFASNIISQKPTIITDATISSANTIATSAILDLQTTTKGFLPPRMTTTERDAISSPATGLTIFNTTTGQLNQFDGTSWFTYSKTLTGSVVWDCPSLSAGSSDYVNVTVTGAAVGDVVSLGLPDNILVGGIRYYAYVSATNTVQIRVENYSTSTQDPSSGTFKVSVQK